MADTVFHSRSQGISAEGVRDQYADGKAAKVWEIFIGDRNSRTQNYKNFLVGLLKERGCNRILDIACGTGVDSMMLIEEGFDVVSVDASDKMLKYALESRWERRKNPKYDKWVIKEANWLSLYNDCKGFLQGGFDAVICLGNSFAHLLDSFGDQREQKHAIANFEKCVKPGGLLLIDHRNYDFITNTGSTPTNSVYYNSQHIVDIKTSVLCVRGNPQLVTLDYVLDVSGEQKRGDEKSEDMSEFRLSYYPHTLESFKQMLTDAFGKKAKFTVYGDFKDLKDIKDPAFYIHVVEKPQ